MAVSNKNLHYGSVDGQFEAVKIQKDFGEPNNRDFAYFVLGGSRFAYASIARLIVIRVSTFIFLSKLFCHVFALSFS